MRGKVIFCIGKTKFKNNFDVNLTSEYLGQNWKKFFFCFDINSVCGAVAGGKEGNKKIVRYFKYYQHMGLHVA
jgi:hypothetical protein